MEETELVHMEYHNQMPNLGALGKSHNNGLGFFDSYDPSFDILLEKIPA